MKTQLTILDNGSRTFTMTEPVSGRKPVLALLMRLLWAAALVLPVFGAQGGVVLTILHSFGSVQDTNGVALDAAFPIAALVQGSDGYFYGTTERGGTMNSNDYLTCGTLFRISTSGALTTLYSFTGGNDGEWPAAALVQGSDGSFYGTTENGGTNNNGTVFKINPNGAYTSLYSFTGGNDGAIPVARLVQGSDGFLYGTTGWGGAYTNQDGSGNGTVLKISTNGALTTLHSFTGGNDGCRPRAGLVQGSDGYLYGTTSDGAKTNQYGGCGTVFKISTDGALTTLYSFTGGNDGEWPAAALVQGSDGNFYGTTGGGGTNYVGTVFKIGTNGALTGLYSFTGTNDGEGPNGLLQGRDGNFYGTASGGTYKNGTVFKISPNGTLTTLYAFGSITNADGAPLDGSWPQAALVQGSDGSFYGTTCYGGTTNYHWGGYGNGTVFRLTIAPDPQLTIFPSGPYMVLTWPTNYSGFTLQSTTNLLSPVWTTDSSPPVVIGGQNVVINTITGRQQFYRLSQ